MRKPLLAIAYESPEEIQARKEFLPSRNPHSLQRFPPERCGHMTDSGDAEHIAQGFIKRPYHDCHKSKDNCEAKESVANGATCR